MDLEHTFVGGVKCVLFSACVRDLVFVCVCVRLGIWYLQKDFHSVFVSDVQGQMYVEVYDWFIYHKHAPKVKAVPGGEQHNYVASKLPRSSLFGQILRQHCMYPLWDIYIIRLNM